MRLERDAYPTFELIARERGLRPAHGGCAAAPSAIRRQQQPLPSMLRSNGMVSRRLASP
jgi:hypothetical protein